MSQKSLRPHLQRLSKKKLIDEILYLYKTFKPVKKYYFNKFSDDSSTIFEKYKKIIGKELDPRIGDPKMHLSVARKAISDFKKINKNPVEIAELMIYYVESGVSLTNTYGDISDPLYNNMVSIYEAALKLMKKNNILPVFKDRAKEVVEQTKNLGWGFHDSLGYLFGEYYRD